MVSPAPYILLDDHMAQTVRWYEAPIDIITARTPAEVAPAFDALERWHKRGAYIAGYTSYELGYWLEPALNPLLPQTLTRPLLQFGVFSNPPKASAPLSCLYTTQRPDIPLTPDWSYRDYKTRFDRHKAYMEAGDVYQINLTFPMRGTYDGDPQTLYAALRHRQAGAYGGIIHLGEETILSLSPELFFQKSGRDMVMRPMKGTRKRLHDTQADHAIGAAMREDIKSQAENLMIVDLLRNDLSRLSVPGSVTVPDLFTLETYPTLHQMTSRIEATLRPDVDFRDIFKSLFPCGSVTGAPKIRAMEIIHELEDTSRGVYCGTMGYIDPNGDAGFNVAIRTLTLKDQTLIYNVGSGVVLDSDPHDEYNECLLKADVLKPQDDYLIETLGWTPANGFAHLDHHLSRLKQSVPDVKKAAIIRQLNKVATPLKQPHRFRLSCSKEGHFDIQCEPLRAFTQPCKIALSRYPLSPDVQVTDYKTSRRAFYDGELNRIQKRLSVDEVIFLNPDGYVCEGSFTSLFVERDGMMMTPTLASGLLPGILRQCLIDAGSVVESVITVDDLRRADALYIGNSLRGLMRAECTTFRRY